MEPTAETITLDVLCVASRDVLGQTKPLVIAAPCRFSNAPGHLRETDTFKEISSVGEQSAKNFVFALEKAREQK
jgi:hypothetical protein